MSYDKYVNIARLMTTYKLEIDNEMLSDNLKCGKCKLVLKDACVGLCGCRFCRGCMDDSMASGSEFCPGVAEDCGESLLSDFVTDFRANKSVSKLPVKCPHNGCLHQCQLAELEEHMRVCVRKSAECPFHKLGCQQDKLAAEEMGEHFQRQNRDHCELLIGIITDIKMEMESHKREIEMLKKNNESNNTKIEMMKCELTLKDGQLKIMIDQMGRVENENKSIKNAIKSIKVEKADLVDRVRILSEKFEREINERHKNDERALTNVIENVDREITAIKAVIGSNKDELDSWVRSVKDDIQLINQDSIKSIKDDMDFIKSNMRSIQTLVGQIDASCEWTIDGDVGKTTWSGDRTSEYFIGAVHPYKYRLASGNIGGILYILLRIYAGENDALLPWPFSGKVAITVADKSKREAYKTISLQYKISRPSEKSYSSSNPICATFSHSSLIRSGLDLTHGVHLSCVINPSVAS